MLAIADTLFLSSSSGVFAYIEASSPQTAGDVATMMSSLYSSPAGSGTCGLVFWYHMLGSQVMLWYILPSVVFMPSVLLVPTEISLYTLLTFDGVVTLKHFRYVYICFCLPFLSTKQFELLKLRVNKCR